MRCMNAKQFIAKFGVEEATRVAERAGTKFSYFSHIARGHRNASFPLAEALVKASDGRLDLISLMTAARQRKRSA